MAATLPILKQSLMGVEAIKETIRKARTSFLSKDEVREYYDFKEKLGAGYFATVYRAVERKSGGEVAIKCIDKSKAMGKEEMLDEEVTILQKVKHPNCVSMIEIFESPKHVYLVMELVTGGELFKRIIQKKVFMEDDAARIIKDLCAGLKYLHEMGIVHRDLKPENILLEDASDNARLKITDFGLSKVMTHKKSFLHSRCGTPAYAAPELIEGQPYGAKVDMWAVGCILYILLSGCPPFWGDTNDELFTRICSGVYPMNTPQWEPISPRAKALVRNLLCLNPVDRLSANDVLKHPWITGKKVDGEKARSVNSLSGLKNLVKKRPPPPGPKSPAPPTEDFMSSMGDFPVEVAPLSSDLGRSTEEILEDELNDKALLLAPVEADTILRMEKKYSTWESFRIEFELGNLLGCTTRERIIEILAKPSTWKVRAMELGFIRPFLFLCSMHPRQRLSYGKLIGIDLSTNLWYGDPHRESWEIISNKLDGLKAKTTRGSTWWDTLLEVSDATLRHFWDKDQSKKVDFKRPKLNKSQILKASKDESDCVISGYEEVFLDAGLKKLMTLQAKKNPKDILPITFPHTADMAKAEGEVLDLISKMNVEFRKKPIVLKMINWYVAEGFKRSQDNSIFMGWVEKERTLSLSSVFLGKGHARVLFPIVFAMLTQRLFLSMYGIYVTDFYPSPDEDALRASLGQSKE
eukprot:CAMPEP_0119118700 /NCGR_PEP_ID=MMETSP1310-20130426/493_1 /TAXON_ID=464262 /ORGANISM="Genus nov. species nov., Strain RCC2339" /LENGTH=691 /DNA_ID=CAMNT_0007108087 /DNA_START=89 /DNA_END=2164 /DNA_ORIENTATION=+